MRPTRRFQASNLVLFVLAFPHALWTWPMRDALALFVGGALIAFVLEAAVVAVGLLDHNIHPQIASVPVTVLLAWPSVVYVFYRIGLLAVPDPVPAAALAAVLATATDVLTDPVGVREGVWEYPAASISRPRYRGVPWWNFVGWLAIVFVTALLPWFVRGLV